MKAGYPSSVFAAAVLLYSVISTRHRVFSQTDFYQGKTVTLIASTAPGGTGDLRVKALVTLSAQTYPRKSDARN